MPQPRAFTHSLSAENETNYWAARRESGSWPTARALALFRADWPCTVEAPEERRRGSMPGAGELRALDVDAWHAYTECMQYTLLGTFLREVDGHCGSEPGAKVAASMKSR